MKKGFEFLMEHPMFDEVDVNFLGTFFYFRKYDETGKVLFGGAMVFPFEMEQNTTHCYFVYSDNRIESSFKVSGDNLDNIEKTPEWFRDLYRKAYKKYDEITRLKKLFMKKENEQ